MFSLVLVLNLTDVSSAANNNSTVLNSSSTTQNAVPVNPKITFTPSQICAASSSVKTFVDTNHRLPNYVTISNYKVTLPQFLQLQTDGLLQLNTGSNASIVLKIVGNSTNPVENVKSGTIAKSEYLSLLQNTKGIIDTTGKVPDSLNSSLGKIRYESLIYIYSKILIFYSTNNRLPTSVTITPMNWPGQTVTTEGTIISGIARPVFIVSDNINGLSADTARINSIINALATLGISAFNYGIGPQCHLSVLSDKNVPNNALILEIAGGADAGAIYEKGTTWYKNLLGTRKDFIAITSGATKITGLAWLPRAHDDNYDPASFTGVAHPDQFLLNNGYHYFEGLTTININQLVQAVYKEATA